MAHRRRGRGRQDQPRLPDGPMGDGPGREPTASPPTHAPGPHRGRAGRPRHRRRDSRGSPRRFAASSEPSSARPSRFPRSCSSTSCGELRVLVVIDHFTEMSQATRDQIRFDAAGVPRRGPGRHRTDGRPGEPPQAHRRADAYRGQDGSRCSSTPTSASGGSGTSSGRRGILRGLLTALADGRRERDITVLLAKLYADQMVARKGEPGRGRAAEDHPRPDAPLSQRAEPNTGGEDNRTVQRDCKAIAWECLKASYRPGPAERRPSSRL